MKAFMDKEFMLQSPTAQHLYHAYAEGMPICDYHCHIPPREIYENRRFDNIAQVWLGGRNPDGSYFGDHYKWRVMRSNGVPEEYITGDKPDRERFQKFAEALPMAIGNPMYHWTNLELHTFFGYDGVLNGDTAEEVWNLCNDKLQHDPKLTVRGLIEQSNVAFIGTTDDPIDSLEWHKKIKEDPTIKFTVAPSFRPDKALNINKPGFAEYMGKLAAAVGKAKRTYCHEVNDEELRKDIWDKCYQKAYDVARQCNADKHLRAELLDNVRAEYLATLPEEEQETKKNMVARYYHDVEKEAMRRMILDEGVRLDGRTTEQIRPIWCEVGYLPGPHGSSIFTRGETQSLSTVTLGTKLDEKIIDEATLQGKERFLLHYNFPPFSTGEAKASRGVGRREIGHGNLAFRALKPMIPADFPYTIRVMSDILESNGSSSMATVCAGTLALMDAGVPIKKPVTGIAMGLITDKGCEKFAVLSDILGDEDHLGDMDFKVTGTRDGITATQMDIKVDGLSYEIMEQALEQAKRGRMHIMDIITETMPAPREDLKPHAPRIVTVLIDKDQIGALIGPGGKIIQDIQEKSGATINIEEVGNKGVVDVAATNKESIDKAMARIRAIVAKPEVGEVYDGIVKSIMPFGAFVEVLPGKDGLLHVSEIDYKRIEKVEDVLKEGDHIQVKLLEIDPKTGKLRLSHKALMPKPEGWSERPERPRGDRPERRERGDRGERRERGDYQDRGERRERPEHRPERTEDHSEGSAE